MDGDEHVLLMNERARAIFGLGGIRGEGKPFHEIIRNADLHEILPGGSTRRRPAPVLRRELAAASPPPRAPSAVNAVRLAPRAAASPGVVMVLHDVTALRRLEQMRTEFVANVSHELRTPLTAIQGYLETLLNGRARRAGARPALPRDRLPPHRATRAACSTTSTDLSNIELGKVLAAAGGGPGVLEVVASVIDIVSAKATARPGRPGHRRAAARADQSPTPTTIESRRS